MKINKKLFLSFAILEIYISNIAKEITTRIIPGKMWYNRAPQCAVWVED